MKHALLLTLLLLGCGAVAAETSPAQVGDAAPDAGVVVATPRDAGTTEPESRSPCSPGPAYAWDTPFGRDDEPPDVPAHECVPRCDAPEMAPEGGGTYYVESLPSGACDVDGERCYMGIRRQCTETVYGSLDNFRCTCSDGAWSCAVAGRGLTACPQVPSPTFSVAPTTYTSCFPIALADNDSKAMIFYTTDGTIPTAASTVYTAPIMFNQTMTINAFAARPGFLESDIAMGTFTMMYAGGTVAGVTFAPQGGGSFASPLEVTLTSATPGATVCYTVDGSAPTCVAGICQSGSSTYAPSTPVELLASGTIRALACQVPAVCTAGNYPNSGVSSATYVIH